MLAYVVLLPVLALCLAGAWLSYQDQARRDPHFAAHMMILGALCAGLWAAGVKWLDDPKRVYVFNLAYDVVVTAVYCVVPVAFFGVRLSAGVALGAILVLAGFVVIKVWG